MRPGFGAGAYQMGISTMKRSRRIRTVGEQMDASIDSLRGKGMASVMTPRRHGAAYVKNGHGAARSLKGAPLERPRVDTKRRTMETARYTMEITATRKPTPQGA